MESSGRRRAVTGTRLICFIRFIRLTVTLILGSLLLFNTGCLPGDGGGYLLEDTFEDEGSGWGSDRRDEFARGYAAGEYFFELNHPDWMAWAVAGRSFDDVSIQVEARLASGSTDGHWGVLCRYADEGNFYYFAISTDGYYGIFRRVDGGELEPLTADGLGMLPSPVIKTGEETNTITATCQGNRLSLVVNGEELTTVTDDTLQRGDVGLATGSGPTGKTNVRFDYFTAVHP